MKIKNILLVVVVSLIELAIMGPFFSTYFLSILTAVTLYLVLKLSFEEALVLVFLIGFIIDISSFNLFPITTTVLLIEFGIVYIAKRKLVDFSNPASIFLFAAGFSLLRYVIFSSIYHGFSSEISTIYSILNNILLSAIFSIIIFKLTLIKKNDSA